MMTIDSITVPKLDWRISSVIASRTSALFIAATGSLLVLAPVRSDAQWWRSAPVDFESCAEAAEKSKTREEKTAALAECNAKFAGRRKPGGGYTYYDFMQDRTFDIAGPNPTPEEQKKIDEQYTAYLDRERRNTIAAALMAKQHQQQQVQQVSLRSEQEPTRADSAKVPVPVASPVKQAARIRDAAPGPGSSRLQASQTTSRTASTEIMHSEPPLRVLPRRP